jgi:hypothetical protein
MFSKNSRKKKGEITINKFLIIKMFLTVKMCFLNPQSIKKKQKQKHGGLPPPIPPVERARSIAFHSPLGRGKQSNACSLAGIVLGV